MIPAPKRWFRYSLRTLFVVVTVLCLWMAWNANLVQKRKHLIRWADTKGVRFNPWIASNKLPPPEEGLSYAPRSGRAPQTTGIGWFRRTLLADRPVETIFIPGVWRNEIEARQIDEAFPEAEIIIGDDR